MLISYEELIGKHKGETCFIFGAGPSLWHNMQHRFFKDIPKYGITIAVNSAVMAVPKFDYWVSNDVLCRKWSWWKDVVAGKGAKVVRDSWKKYKKELNSFLFFSPRPTSEDVINVDDKGLAYCSSVPTSIDLAIQMGCKKIFLFGVDHSNHEGRHHFWQYMNKQEWPVSKPNVQDSCERQQEVFNISMKAYEALWSFAEHSKVDIYNVSRISYGSYWSKVKIFRRIEMKDIKRLICI